MRRPINFADLLAYGLTTCFAVFGIWMLAGGDSEIGETRYIRSPVSIVGQERTIFGFALLGAGYICMRWLFRAPFPRRNWSVEVQVFAAFAVAGYVAYRFGVA